MAAASKFGFLLRPKWLGFHLLCIGAVIGMILAGFWQLRRLDDRRDANAAFIEQVEQSPVPIETLLDPDRSAGSASDDALNAVVNRRVVASGTYLPSQVVLFNRSQGGRAVDNVLTPLVLDDGRVLLVNRGSIPVEGDVPAPPAVAVTLEGRLRPSEVRQRGELSDADAEVIEQTRRVDLALLAPQFGSDVLPLYVELVSSDPAVGQGDPTPLDTPVLGEGNHLSYAFQWFIFAACVAAGWVLAVRRSLKSRAPQH